ncbi:MAG: type II toxin-antitoxin system VapC family toxin [Gammaproteobacteria bacterium]|nr:type II toxin-antitoxin system VapC family toxin [Gammaproteobacteria bacterium]
MIILDTHIWVNWILLGDSGLTKPILAAMNSQSSMAVSAISCFEVSLLVKQRKLELPLPVDEWLVEALSASGVDCLPVTCEISRLSVALQDIHKDPADRIIIATAITHDALLASVDSAFPEYSELIGRLIAR